MSDADDLQAVLDNEYLASLLANPDNRLAILDAMGLDFHEIRNGDGWRIVIWLGGEPSARPRGEAPK